MQEYVFYVFLENTKKRDLGYVFTRDSIYGWSQHTDSTDYNELGRYRWCHQCTRIELNWTKTSRALGTETEWTLTKIWLRSERYDWNQWRSQTFESGDIKTPKASRGLGNGEGVSPPQPN